jgi:hypothetical protein
VADHQDRHLVGVLGDRRHLAVARRRAPACRWPPRCRCLRWPRRRRAGSGPRPAAWKRAVRVRPRARAPVGRGRRAGSGRRRSRAAGGRSRSGRAAGRPPRAGWRDALARAAGSSAAVAGLLQHDGDEQVLVLAHGEVGAEPVPFGQRAHRHAVEPRDGIGGLAPAHAVAHGLDPGCTCGAAAGRGAGVGLVDGAARDGGDVGARRPGLTRRGRARTSPSRRGRWRLRPLKRPVRRPSGRRGPATSATVSPRRATTTW